MFRLYSMMEGVMQLSGRPEASWSILLETLTRALFISVFSSNFIKSRLKFSDDVAVTCSTPVMLPRPFSITSETSLSTRSGLAPGYTVTTIRYGVFTLGSRLVCIPVTETKPSMMTMITATNTVNGRLTLNFSMFSYRFHSCALRGYMS